MRADFCASPVDTDTSTTKLPGTRETSTTLARRRKALRSGLTLFFESAPKNMVKRSTWTPNSGSSARFSDLTTWLSTPSETMICIWLSTADCPACAPALSGAAAFRDVCTPCGSIRIRADAVNFAGSTAAYKAAIMATTAAIARMRIFSADNFAHRAPKPKVGREN